VLIFQVDILDGNVMRDNYGVLVIQTPTTPPDDVSFPQYNAVSCDNRPSSPATLPVNQTDAPVRGQGRTYKRHIPFWAAIKRGCWNRYQVAKNVWPYMISISLAYFVTLCLFPGIESEIISCNLHSWMPVILISIFNLMDFAGKIISSIPYDWPCGRMVLCTLCRIIIVPLVMLCAAPRSEPFFSAEGWSIILSGILGLTNGYFGSIPMILAPSKVPDEQKELTGNIMTLSYSLGLTGGSVVAYMLNAWLGAPLSYDPCNPSNSTLIHDLHNMTELRKVLTEYAGH
jgi:solute carrier family 29 (equilibrative nucleoside transporter) protein 4